MTDKLQPNQQLTSAHKVIYSCERGINLTLRRLDNGEWTCTVNENTDVRASGIENAPALIPIVAKSFSGEAAVANAVLDYLLISNEMSEFLIEAKAQELRKRREVKDTTDEESI